MLETTIAFPKYTGIRCLMMPFIQGKPDSVPQEYSAYAAILDSTFLERGAVGYLTIDESPVLAGNAHRAARAKYGRALHTEAGSRAGQFGWGGGSGWGSSYNVTLDPDLEILLANNLSGSCAYWNATHLNTSFDGDIGDCAPQYPYEDATLMQAGDVHRIGILTPHESVPVQKDYDRQFLRIAGSGVHGRENYFTLNTHAKIF